MYSRFSAVFKKSTNISGQELSFNYILRESLISKYLLTVRTKTDLRLLELYR